MYTPQEIETKSSLLILYELRVHKVQVVVSTVQTVHSSSLQSRQKYAQSIQYRLKYALVETVQTVQDKVCTKYVGRDSTYFQYVGTDSRDQLLLYSRTQSSKQSANETTDLLRIM